jgi:hypothetical protein
LLAFEIKYGDEVFYHWWRKEYRVPSGSNDRDSGENIIEKGELDR